MLFKLKCRGFNLFMFAMVPPLLVLTLGYIACFSI